jgi:SWI/SNF related-matrix-associated actin-dependent regulator of chromatin subfamily C
MLVLEGGLSSSAVGTVAPLVLRPDTFARDAGPRLCGACGADCTRRCFALHGAPGSSCVCPDCHRLGRLPSGATADATFVCVESGVAVQAQAAGAEWRDDEVLRLLEGLETHGENWRRVAEHVGGRTPQQVPCLFSLSLSFASFCGC